MKRFGGSIINEWGKVREKGKREGKNWKRKRKKLQLFFLLNSIRNAFQKIRGDLEVDLCMAPKGSMILLKYKNFLCKEGSAPFPQHQTSLRYAWALKNL